jgi:hypothetical protein
MNSTVPSRRVQVRPRWAASWFNAFSSFFRSARPVWEKTVFKGIERFAPPDDRLIQWGFADQVSSYLDRTGVIRIVAAKGFAGPETRRKAAGERADPVGEPRLAGGERPWLGRAGALEEQVRQQRVF